MLFLSEMGEKNHRKEVAQHKFLPEKGEVDRASETPGDETQQNEKKMLHSRIQSS